jgi:ribose transport system permease protein
MAKIDTGVGPETEHVGAAADRQPRQSRPWSSRVRDYGIVVSVLVLFVVLSVESDVFLTKTNLLNILDQFAPAGIIACAQTLVIIGGGFDLSVGAMFALAGVVAAQTAPHVGIWPGLGLGVLMGVGLGLVNAFLITVIRMNAFIATLASSFMFYGLGQVMTGGGLVTVNDPAFQTLGNGAFAGVKYSVWLLLAVILVAGLLLKRATVGRHICAVGGNAEAARLSGIRVNRVRALTFALSGMAAGIAGVLYASRISQGQANSGNDYTLMTIAAVVIGGTSILGGEGAVWKTALGVLLLALIGNGFNLLNINPTYQQIVQGGIIVIAVAIDTLSRRAEA